MRCVCSLSKAGRFPNRGSWERPHTGTKAFRTFPTPWPDHTLSSLLMEQTNPTHVSDQSLRKSSLQDRGMWVSRWAVKKEQEKPSNKVAGGDHQEIWGWGESWKLCVYTCVSKLQDNIGYCSQMSWLPYYSLFLVGLFETKYLTGLELHK